MSEPKRPLPSGALPWQLLIVCVLAMVGAIALAMLLIPQLSLNAAIRGGITTISIFLFMQLGLRVNAWYRRRRNGV
jgi:hypothetical protein